MARTAASIQTEIDRVDAAIAKAEAAQSYSGNGRSKSNANLATLYRRKDQLETMLDRVENGAIRRAVISHVGGEFPNA
jgi:multidrug resistance efflux pump